MKSVCCLRSIQSELVNLCMPIADKPLMLLANAKPATRKRVRTGIKKMTDVGRGKGWGR